MATENRSWGYTRIQGALAHYHVERNHQGVGNRLILPVVTPTPGHGRIVCRERLGGLLKYYHPPAA
jgi:putative transposase